MSPRFPVLLCLPLVVSACASAKPAPFIMYSSPLLQSDMPVVRPSGGPPASSSGAAKASAKAADPDEGGRAAQSEAVEAVPPKQLPAASQGTTPSPQPSQPAQRAEASEQAAASAQFAWAMYKLNGLTFSTEARRSVPTLYRECRKKGKIAFGTRPRVGDMVFFHNVGDANGDGRNNDWYTLAGIVESIEPKSADIGVLLYRRDKVERIRLNLDHPAKASLNAALRTKRQGDLPYTQYLAGQLFAGFCSALGDRSKVVVSEAWTPGAPLPPPAATTPPQ